MLDTGADGTALSTRDWQVLGLRTADLAPATVSSAGVGGLVRTSVEQCALVLTHDDGRTDAWNIEIELLPADDVSAYIPSILGRDILINYRLYMSIAERDLRL